MPKGDERAKKERDKKEKEGKSVCVEGWGGDNTKAMVADCSDNGLSSSVGLRGRRGVQAFRALPPNTSLVVLHALEAR